MSRKRASNTIDLSSMDEALGPSGSKQNRSSRNKRGLSPNPRAELAGPSGSKRNRPSQNKRHAAPDSDEDEEVEQQPLAQKRPRQSQALISCNLDPVMHRSGKLLRMHLVNFMSHSNTRITFNPSVTFIVGANGSGKSAIQAALMVVFGARARQTNRASAAKDYIKRGESYAEIEVVLANVGNPFDPEDYGPEIRVKRKIYATGSSSYIITGASGHIISRSASELHRLLDALEVQVDNPVFLLNQDMARVFLKELEPEKSFDLFERATKIDLIRADIEKVENELPRQEQSIAREKATKTKLVEGIAELKDKLNRILGLADLKEQLSNKEKELLWAKVQKYEDELERSQNELRNTKENHDKLKKLTENKDHLNEKLTGEVNELNRELENKSTQFAEVSNEAQQIRQQKRQEHASIAEINVSIKDYQRRVQRAQKDIRELATALADSDSNTVEDIQELRNQNEQLRHKILEEKEQHAAIIKNATNDLRMLKDTNQRTKEDINEHKFKLNEAQGILDQINRRISELQASSKDKLAIYGNQVKMFIADLNKMHSQGQLSEMPLGPIGQYLEVPNPKYRDVIENAIQSGTLQAFIVNSSQDRARIEALIKRKYQDFSPFIITARFLKKIYDVKKGCVKPPSGTRLLMSELKCTNPVVMNVLIDRVQVETILIADSKDVAERVTQNRENVPANLMKVIVPAGMEYFPEPKYRMYSTIIKPARYVQVAVEDRITQLRADGTQVNANVQSIREALKGLAHQQRKNLELLNEKEALLKSYEAKTQELASKLREIENYDYPEQQDLRVLKKEKQDLELFVQEVQEKISTTQNKLNTLESRLREINESCHAKDEELREIQADIDSIKKKVVDKGVELRNLNAKFAIQQKKLAELQETIVQLESKETQVSQLLDAALFDARAATSQRFENISTEEDVEQEIAKLQRSIARCKDADTDPQEVQQQLKAKEEALITTKKEYQQMIISNNQMKEAIRERINCISQTRKHGVMKLQIGFTRIMNARNYEGRLNVDSQRRQIHITVVPRDKHVTNATSTTKALSGGERSFTTVCYLLALWSCSQHAFYFLDEYDVFTDEVNRETITRMLLNFAQHHKNQQFIFMTPQAMTLTSTDDVTIVRLHKNE